jgi:hypothetical protein
MAEQTKVPSPGPSSPAPEATGSPKVQVGIIFLGIAAMMLYQECASGIALEQKKDPKVGTADALANYFLGAEEEQMAPNLKDNEVMIQFCMS